MESSGCYSVLSEQPLAVPTLQMWALVVLLSFCLSSSLVLFLAPHPLGSRGNSRPPVPSGSTGCFLLALEYFSKLENMFQIWVLYYLYYLVINLYFLLVLRRIYCCQYSKLYAIWKYNTITTTLPHALLWRTILPPDFLSYTLALLLRLSPQLRAH